MTFTRSFSKVFLPAGLLLTGIKLSDSLQAQSLTASTNAAPAPAVVQAPNAGLVNGWLDRQWPAAKAWDVGGEVRARYEIKDNAGSFPNRDFIREGQINDNNFLSLREKVHVGYNQEWFSIFAEGRDSSTTGDKRNPNPDADQFDLHQAFLALGNAEHFPLLLKVGRQQMSYGDERFVETGEWGNLMRTFDAVKLRYEVESFWVDGFTSHPVIPNNGEFNEDNSRDLFSGIYASTRTLIPKNESQLYVFAHNVSGASATITNTAGTGPSAKDIYTIGARIKSLPGQFQGWDYGVEIAGQLGSFNQNGRRVDQRALAAFVNGGYTWEHAGWQPRLGFDYSYGSGDGNPNDNTHGTFDQLFGAIHKYYGLMDLTGLRNMHSPSINLTVKPVANLTVGAQFFSYWLADTHDLFYNENSAGRVGNGYGIHSQFNGFVGNEVDLFAGYTVKTFLNLQAGYGHFFVGDYVRQSVNLVPANGGTVGANWFYVQTKFIF